MRILGGLAYGASVVALASGFAAIGTEAHAGAFAVREQSAYYQGMSFAGAGTGDTLSSMYWNSAAAASAPGMNTETHISLILPDSEITASDGFATGPAVPTGLPAPFPPVAGLGLGSESGDLADPALVPASYANYQINDRLFVGLAINSGFGLVTKPDEEAWAGSVIALTSDVFTINVNPTVAYKLTPELTIGAGLQIEYLNVRLNNARPGISELILGPSRSAELDDIGFGFTAGFNWTPRQGTSIGVGYRSAVEFDLEGDYDGIVTGEGSADLTLPDILTIGLRHALTDRVDVLAGFEWTNWSRLGKIPVNVGGIVPETLELDYEDGFFYSLGLEYKYSPDTTFRVGVAYEESPINDDNRNVLLPDSDRIWLSVGATQRLTEKITVDLGYTHIFAEDGSICRALAAGAPSCSSVPVGTPTLIEAESEGSVDIISASFKYKWGGAEPALEPLK
jgi:long-chain fatty acid transport protein